MRRQIGVLVFITTILVQAKFLDILTPVGESSNCEQNIYTIIEQAYTHYPSISASEKALLGAHAQVKAAKWNYFPSLSVDISQGRSGHRGETYRIDQPLWTGGKIDAKIDLAYAQEEEARSLFGESAYDLATQVLDVLKVLIQSDGDIRAFERGKKDLLELAQMLKRRVAAGVSSESDQALLQSRIYQIESDLITAKQRYTMARAQLELLTGKKVQCGISFKNDKFLRKKMSYKTLEQGMLETHPSLKKKRAEVKIAEAQKKDTDAQIMPNISLRGEYQRGSLNGDNSGDESNVYLAVSYNPGAGLSSIANMEGARYKVLQAADEMLVQQQKLKDTLVRDYSEYLTARSRIKVVKGTIESSRKVLESYKRLFLAGKRQWLDVVNAAREVTMNYVSLSSLRATYIIAAYRLALDAGKIKVDTKKQW